MAWPCVVREGESERQHGMGWRQQAAAARGARVGEEAMPSIAISGGGRWGGAMEEDYWIRSEVERCGRTTEGFVFFSCGRRASLRPGRLAA